ncbi:polysaccharide deacetylase family protein [Catenovulum sp. SM1970]|uniref:cellulose-binding domain-containing protein n=1 Tax=Marinifaba aquimaris TaxID=2741323 RepID=UPI001574AF9B|nr:cellulose-binding domain-containing protein [Marinifaba aquimaris]NTS76652.1 polysaccharide deacetylase family protein [Marinifaba aquimaris]
MTRTSKIASAIALALCSTQAVWGANCPDINTYPDFPQLAWDGSPSHANTGDQIIHNDIIWQANWWTNSEPSDNNSSWQNLGPLDCAKDPVKPNGTALFDGSHWIIQKFTPRDLKRFYRFKPAIVQDGDHAICAVNDFVNPEIPQCTDEIVWPDGAQIDLSLKNYTDICELFNDPTLTYNHVLEGGFIHITELCSDWRVEEFAVTGLSDIEDLTQTVFETTLPEISIATWQNNAPAAYAMQHDDWCGGIAPGILEHVYPEVSQRGLTTSVGVVAGNCSVEEWQQAKDFVDAGFSIFNHSMTHGFNDAPSWDPDAAITWDDTEEIHQTNMLIKQNTGFVPSVFGIPYGIWSSKSDDYVKQYIGITGLRAPTFVDGEFNVSNGINAADNFDNYRVLGNLYDDQWSPYNLNNEGAAKITSYLDETIAQGGFGLQYFHGVNDNSYHSVPLADYQTFLDYLKVKVDNNEVWLDTPENIIKYLTVKDNCQAEITAIPFGYVIDFDTNINRGCHTGDLPLTLNMKVHKKVAKITSLNENISFEQTDDVVTMTTPVNRPIVVILHNTPADSLDGCLNPAYEPGKTYNWGDRVNYLGQNWQANWTIDISPSDSHWGAWSKVTECQ